MLKRFHHHSLGLFLVQNNVLRCIEALHVKITKATSFDAFLHQFSLETAKAQVACRCLVFQPKGEQKLFTCSMSLPNGPQRGVRKRPRPWWLAGRCKGRPSQLLCPRAAQEKRLTCASVSLLKERCRWVLRSALSSVGWKLWVRACSQLETPSDSPWVSPGSVG